MASFGGTVASSAVPAWASVTTNPYTIGTPGPAFTNVSVTPSAAIAGESQSYVIATTAPSAIPSGDTITVTDTAGDAVVATTVLAGVSLVDLNAANCLQSGGGSVASGALVVTLTSSCNIAAGDTIKIGLTVTDPTSNFSFSVASTVNGTEVNSNSVTINAVPPTIAASPLATGYGATYTIAGLGASPSLPWNSTTLTATNVVEPITSLVVVSTPVGALAPVPTATNSTGWYASANGAGYSVTYTPSGGSLTTDTVQSATTASTDAGTNNQVSLLLASGIPAGSSITLTAEGLNPSASGAYPVTITPEWTNPPTSTPSMADQVPYSTPPTETGTVTFGTSVTGVTVTPSPTLGSASATYTVGFKSTSGVGAGGYICLSEPSTIFANSLPSTASPTLSVLLTDTTSEAQFVLPSADVADVVCGTSTRVDLNSLQITLPTGEAITPGDQVTVTVTNVDNPRSGGTYSDFAVSTSADTVVVDAPAYQIGDSSNAGVSVAVSPVSQGSLATYTVSNLHASAAVVPGATITIQPSGTGTVLPDNASLYTLTDSTTTTGSGALGLLSYVPATVTSAGAVTLSLPNTINSGDMLTITISDVLNPPLAGSYVLSLGGTAAIAAPPVVAYTIPGAPIIGTATAGNAQATVSFSAPASNGGGTITSYTVTATDLTTPANGGQIVSGTASPITVTGLSAGDSYSFTVTATNGAGTGPASAASNTVVPSTTPGPTYTVSVTPSAATTGQLQSYVITTTAPSAIPSADTITVTDSADNVPVSGATNVSLVDENAANCVQYGTNGGSATTTSGLVIILDSTCNIAAGDTIKIGLTVTDPTSNFSFRVVSTTNPTAVNSNLVTINAVPPTTSASSAIEGLRRHLHDRRTGHRADGSLEHGEPDGRWNDLFHLQPCGDVHGNRHSHHGQQHRLVWEH